MKIKIVADSSANMYTLDGGVEFACAPLTIRTDEREFVDNESLNVLEMVDYLSKYKGLPTKERKDCRHSQPQHGGYGASL